jgi:diguanylate cyclase (GGDEF)-like protein
MLGVSIGRHERAALRERALATTGSDLVAADKRSDAYTVAMTGARALIEPHAEVSLTLSIGTSDQLRIVAATNDRLVGLTFDVGKSPALVERLVERRVFELTPELTRTTLRLMGMPPDSAFAEFNSSLLVVPLIVQHELRGAITVTTSKSLPDECKDGLATLATEVALSLETIDLNARLSHQAYHDPLTGLANRLLLADKAREAFELAQATGRQTGLLVLDLDSFKIVNDTLGHAAGDRMLVDIAQRLTRSLPEAYCTARLGGDEFAILVHGLEHPRYEAQLLAEQLLRAFREPLLLDGNVIVPEASIGIVVGDESQGFDALLADADLAMYAAKRAGKGRFVMFETGLRKAARRQLELEVELRRAIEREEFELVYQPVVEFTTGELIGLEALVRWRHPSRGLLAPGEFIKHAEATGLIVPLGRWILREACRQASEWGLTKASGAPVRIGVNLSPRQLQQGDLEQMVRSALAETGVSANALTLEITETGLVERTDEMLRQLRTVQDLGVHLALDDFGTGYSSLAYLRDFPFDVVKIDRSFIDGVDTNPEQAAFVSAIVSLTHTLEMRAVGEGIETAAQYARLRALGCDLGQGYHIARPLSADAVQDWVTSTGAERAA